MERWLERAVSAGLRLVLDKDGRGVLEAPGYRRTTPYTAGFLERLAAAYPAGWLVEEVLLAEEPGRLADRIRPLLERLPIAGRILHWGAGAGGAARAVARLGLEVDAVESNRLYHPLARERLQLTKTEEAIRILAPEECRGAYDLLLLVGDRALRSAPLSESEIEAAIVRLRPEGRILLAGWPRGREIPAARGDRIPASALRRTALLRIARPRGNAPVARRLRRWAGAALAPIALCAPALTLRAFGESYRIVRPPRDP